MPRITLSKAWDGFIIEQRAAARSHYTLRNYRYTWQKVRLFLEEKYDGKDPKFHKLDRSFWVEFMAWLREEYTFTPTGVAAHSAAAPRHLSPKSLRNVHADLSAFYTWAVKTKFAKKHIMRSIDRPEANRPVIKTFTKEQCEKLLRACDRKVPSSKQKLGTSRITAARDRAIVLFSKRQV